MAHLSLTFLSMGLFSTFFGCHSDKSNAQASSNGNEVVLEEMTSRMDSAEGWNDIFLKVTKTTETDSTFQYVAKGLYKGLVVGLQFDVRSDIKAGLVGGKPVQAGFEANGVSLVSIGPESDVFIKSLAELYGQSVPDAFSKQRLSATAFSLNESAVDLERKGRYKLKLFFEDPELYSEVYVNIDTEKGEIELAEKDEGYRETLIKILSK